MPMVYCVGVTQQEGAQDLGCRIQGPDLVPILLTLLSILAPNAPIPQPPVNPTHTLDPD